jgi:hypothetical protein
VSLIERPGQFPGRGSGGGEFVGTFVQFSAEFDVRLFRSGESALKFVDVWDGAETGGAPRLFAEQLRELGFELADPADQTLVTFEYVGQVSAQGCVAEGVHGVEAGSGRGLGGEDFGPAERVGDRERSGRRLRRGRLRKRRSARRHGRRRSRRARRSLPRSARS